MFYLGFGWAKIGLDLFFFFGTIGGSVSPASSSRKVSVRIVPEKEQPYTPHKDTAG